MQGLVDSIAKERKKHIETIENLGIKELKEMVWLHETYLFSVNLTTFQDYEPRKNLKVK